jgi:hypothetical protein
MKPDMLEAGATMGRRGFWTERSDRYVESHEVRSWAKSERPLSREERAILKRLERGERIRRRAR